MKPAADDTETLRRQMLARRDDIAPELRDDWSARITERLEELPAYRSAALPMAFVSFRSEVDTRRHIRTRLARGLPLAVPKTDPLHRRLVPYRVTGMDDLVPGLYGIPEPDPERAAPVAPSDIDLVLVPGSVFDLRGGRYGYGGGYYDRFLAHEAPGALRVGLGFDFQVLDQIPLGPYDQRLDVLVTERRTLFFSR
ncbi:5-formyltetrahydrofolate cyclo-ligase [Dissulfurirhabdus thermomarina]|uniref:5-formyltetrahydrofolate cyclo-ligase n=1 Tax=Dissulfurirhabdus thermomarina TaxID=1765737 RepID=A0A6N9TRX4_DISTH|nr:5-formyltetrahydrofolate cyclo-ligase [Dissulfurirhabdus thermomarina]NDY42504.1 5-formyltetrahydrofolate cyclo-ligase [Dissulfurirhabdus thermomarina]NMX24192.1 5-formyltetrahydrofolate cyclo-ligase [Dissulfurirhabdus thermomarina]